MDEIIDYLLWKHKRSIEQGICLLTGFLLGTSQVMAVEGSPIRAAIAFIVAILLMLIMFRNDRPRTYNLPDDESTPASYRKD